ncbi:MAG: AI-2E family transporter [Planctomycetes bacterium]|nr:AI-2E family transporter [Planctomycetota bacterium]
MRKPLPPPWDRFVPFAQKILVWALVFGILWFLRPFFFLVFLTFVFGYVMQHVVARLERAIKARWARVIVVFLALLGIIVSVGLWIGPGLAQQAKDFAGAVRKNVGVLDDELEKLRSESETLKSILPPDLRTGDILREVFDLGPSGTSHGRTEADAEGPEARLARSLTAASEGLASAMERLAALAEREEAPDGELKSAAGSLATATADLADAARGLAATGAPAGGAEQSEMWRGLLQRVITLAGQSLTYGSAFLLSLLFSFLIVLDFPNLARGARHLHDTRLQFVYDEISDSVFHFGRVLGQALEAQLIIALLNTAFTAVGLSLMGLPNLAFLSTIVFVCSFIPVAGVFMSSVPICLTALTVDGLGLALWAVLFITLIHMIEAYILNPKIYGAHLRMNPVLVLAILVISHHLFGMWGLILGVPVVNYAVKHVIQGKEDGKGLEAAA